MPATIIDSSKNTAPVKKSKTAVSIFVDHKAQTVHFYLQPLGDKDFISYESQSYRPKTFDQTFFKVLTDITAAYAGAHPEVSGADITLILPDYLFATDAVSIPSLGRRKTESSLAILLDNLYKNRDELEINKTLSFMTKKITVYSTVAFNKALKAAFVASCAAGGMTPNCVTFRSNAYVDGVGMLSQKLHASSYLLLDVRETESNFMFVSKGRVTGFYPLPFGYKILQRSSVAAENLLFDHGAAELTVLNAKERAKAKQLTMMRSLDSDEDIDSLELMSNDPTKPGSTSNMVRTLPQKVARSVPKFMQRPAPKNQEETAYENFTIFMKWALNLLRDNEKLAVIGAPEAVYVNLPEDCAHVVETANAEENENGIPFSWLDLRAESATVAAHLDLYGGLYAGQLNKVNTF